jgi:hypothetical protein
MARCPIKWVGAGRLFVLYGTLAKCPILSAKVVKKRVSGPIKKLKSLGPTPIIQVVSR